MSTYRIIKDTTVTFKANVPPFDEISKTFTEGATIEGYISKPMSSWAQRLTKEESDALPNVIITTTNGTMPADGMIGIINVEIPADSVQEIKAKRLGGIKPSVSLKDLTKPVRKALTPYAATAEKKYVFTSDLTAVIPKTDMLGGGTIRTFYAGEVYDGTVVKEGIKIKLSPKEGDVVIIDPKFIVEQVAETTPTEKMPESIVDTAKKTASANPILFAALLIGGILLLKRL